MNLIRAKTWQDNHKEWRGRITAKMKVTTMEDLSELDRRYIRRIQVNAMAWCLGRSKSSIDEQITKLVDDSI